MSGDYALNRETDMADVHTKEQRSYNMSRVKGRDTGLELGFRKRLFEKGIRGYRVIVKIPGKPDIAFTKQRLAVFIDGCFWHKCPTCFTPPSSNRDFWERKIDGNALRDKKVNKELGTLGFRVIRFWEHEIRKDMDRCVNKIEKMLLNGRNKLSRKD